jgi:hypothetical protein
MTARRQAELPIPELRAICGPIVGKPEVTPLSNPEKQPQILHCVQDDIAVGGG